MLKKPTTFTSTGGAILTIGECSKEQLQLLAYETITDLEQIDQRLQKAYKLIRDCLP